MHEITDYELHAARLLRLIREGKELTAMIQEAHGKACTWAFSPPPVGHEADVRIVESEFANARRSLLRLLGETP